jgi:inorganic pyrophosphatase/exopolyphosphatase
MFGNGIRYGYQGKSEKKVAGMKLVKFTRNKLKLAGMNHSSKTAFALIQEYYKRFNNNDTEKGNMMINIQKNFSHYRSWVIEYCA